MLRARARACTILLIVREPGLEERASDAAAAAAAAGAEATLHMNGSRTDANTQARTHDQRDAIMCIMS